MATVVVVLSSTPCRSSMPMPTLVRASSVRSGPTSLIALTSVVLPTPKPPAMRILKAASGPPGPGSESPEPIQHLPQHLSAGLLAGRAGPAAPCRPCWIGRRAAPGSRRRQSGSGPPRRPSGAGTTPGSACARAPGWLVGGLSRAPVAMTMAIRSSPRRLRARAPARHRVRPHDRPASPSTQLPARARRGLTAPCAARREPRPAARWPGPLDQLDISYATTPASASAGRRTASTCRNPPR